MKSLRVQVWSDIACPWCYVGKRRLEAALDRFPHRDQVEVLWRSFELDPNAPPVHDLAVSYAERLARKYRSSVAQAEEMIRRMTEVGAAEGLSLRFDRVRPGNTFDAHRLLHLARARGKQGALKERLFRAYMTDGEPIGEREVLVRLAAEEGLDAEAVRAALGSDAHAREVRADEEEARRHGISGVPFFVFGVYGVSGAHPPDVLLQALGRAWDEAPDEPAAEGAICGPDGCA
jgi:predicted DsbA family dithiol-disulfide isomerase